MLALVALASTPVASAAAPSDPPLTPRDCRLGLRSRQRPRVPNAVAHRVDPYPLLIWYDPSHPHSVEILDDIADTLRAAWQVQVDELGFRPPILPDDLDGPEFDVYLIEYQPFAAYVSADLPYEDVGDGDGYNAATAYMVVDRRLPARWVPSYLAHEFNHVLQYATDWTEPTLPIWEGTATSAQEWTVGPAGMWEIDVPSLQEASRFPTLTGDSYAIYYEYGIGYTFEYGAAFWVRFLDEKHGAGDGRAGARLWENAAQEGLPNEPDAVDAFAATGRADAGALLNEFALVRLLTGDDWDPRGLSDAGGWGPEYAVPADPLDADTLLGEHTPSLGPPMITGQVFWELDVAGLDDGATLRIEAPSASGLGTGLMVATWSEDGGVDQLATVDEGEETELTLPLQGLSRVVVAITNLGPAGWDGDQDSYVEGDQRLRLSIVDDGAGPVDRGLLVGGGGCAQVGAGPAWLAALTAAAAAARRTGDRSRGPGRRCAPSPPPRRGGTPAAR
jgi:hypothetical protein